MEKKKYIKPEVHMIEAEVECNQYWQSGWRNNDGTIIDQGKKPDGSNWDGTAEVDGGNSYWKGNAKQSPIWDEL